MNLFGVFVIIYSIVICNGQPVDEQSNVRKSMIHFFPGISMILKSQNQKITCNKKKTNFCVKINKKQKMILCELKT